MTTSKTEIRNQMAELQRQYAQLAGELKKLEEHEKRGLNKTRFKDYTLKILVQGVEIGDNPQVYPVTDEDRESAYQTRLFTIVPTSDENSRYVLVKSAEGLKEVITLFNRLYAAERLRDKDEKEVDRYAATVLGKGESFKLSDL